jgi:hypothetical protein
MTVWIVEDNDNDAAKAEAVIEKVAQERSVQILRNRQIKWDSEFCLSGKGRVPKAEHPPEIVILELSDDDDKFQAERFLEELRSWEAELGPRASKSRVILWSVKTGRSEVQEFLNTRPTLDLYVGFTDSKQPDLLEVAIARCWQSLEDGRYR